VDDLVLRFYLEEADVAQITPGDRLEMQLDAYPDLTFSGVLRRIGPALVMVDGSLLVQVWGEFADPPEVRLLPGMSLEVEVIASEAQDVLLVPIQALRQNADGSSFVEVLQPDGTFKAASVSVGLKDLANAQVLSGVQVGDQVSTAAR
jgi:multidrug efflux pump subunit AcrA (membrane-fusion protein)